jgi:nicotinate-nucleotide adenylyltransferase
MTCNTPRIGILGGTFDPIHLGHLAVADAACDALQLAEVLLVPSNHPPHRRVEPAASGYHRFAMVALAAADRTRLLVSDMELQAESWSYTSVTLRRLHAAALAASQLFFITGADAFAEIATWKDYPGILDLAHFVVVSRPGHPAGAMPERLPMLARRMIMCGSGDRDAGEARRDSPAIWLVDAATPDVSSTEVRARASAGEPLEGLVPQRVAAHIRRHRLYRAATPEPGSQGGADG